MKCIYIIPCSFGDSYIGETRPSINNTNKNKIKSNNKKIKVKKNKIEKCIIKLLRKQGKNSTITNFLAIISLKITWPPLDFYGFYRLYVMEMTTPGNDLCLFNADVMSIFFLMFCFIFCSLCCVFFV